MITDLIPGIDLLSTFLTLSYILWLVSREWRSAGAGRGDFEKRSLMNQHVVSRGVAAV